MTDASLAMIGVGFPMLKKLSLTYCPCMKDNSLLSIALGCPHLSAIDLLKCRSVSDIGIIEVVKKCPKLESLGIIRFAKVNELSTIRMTEVNSQMKGLVLAATSVTDAVLHKVAEAYPNLHSLNLLFSKPVKNTSIKNIAQCCQRLRHSYSKNCNEITQSCYSVIPKGCEWIHHHGEEIFDEE